MPGSVIEVTEPGTGLAATSRFGSLELQLEPGIYTVTARAGPGKRPCGGKAEQVRVGRRRVQVHLFCSIP